MRYDTLLRHLDENEDDVLLVCVHDSESLSGIADELKDASLDDFLKLMADDRIKLIPQVGGLDYDHSMTISRTTFHPSTLCRMLFLRDGFRMPVLFFQPVVKEQSPWLANG